jgi:hypothetical protein
VGTAEAWKADTYASPGLDLKFMSRIRDTISCAACRITQLWIS